jgi:mRNA interferase MazF
MVSPAIGKVVLVPFPFSDLSNSKLRPAAILANAGRGDWILCQITSNPYGDPYAIALTERSFVNGSLKINSVARPGKLFTGSGGLFVNEVGILSDIALKGIVSGVIAILQGRDDSKTA